LLLWRSPPSRRDNALPGGRWQSRPEKDARSDKRLRDGLFPLPGWAIEPRLFIDLRRLARAQSLATDPPP
jgi:hypothetical protein